MGFKGLWLFGLSGAGKTTLGDRLPGVRLDGDILRAGVCKDLGFSRIDRGVNINRAISIAAWELEHEKQVIATFITPYERLRASIRNRLPGIGLVWITCPLAVCIERDPKGLYKKAIAGEIPDFTGISAPFETPKDFDLAIDTSMMGVDEAVSMLLGALDG